MEYPVNIYLTADTIISALGFSTEENMHAIREYRTGIRPVDDKRLYHIPFTPALINKALLREKAVAAGIEYHTLLEQLFILALQEVIRKSGLNPSDPGCGLILSTTKGNIDRLETDLYADEAYLARMGERIAAYFGFQHNPIVISTACISGVTALITASRLIAEGAYTHLFVAGGDLLNRFVVTGFQSFKSISPEICRPYDKQRNGLSLGEACGALLVTADKQYVKEDSPIVVEGGAITNDANHISGPSRTGDGLYYAIEQAMQEAGITTEDVSFVNAHGTATVYNDEMESKAIHWAGLDKKPVNSLKPYWGHTLGASGVIESIACMDQLRNDLVYGTLGYEETDLTYPLDVNSKHRQIPLHRCVKTASGFGGCNAALVLTSAAYAHPVKKKLRIRTHTVSECAIRSAAIYIDENAVFRGNPTDGFPAFIRAAYKNLALDDRKFYKMDDLCKLGYITAAYLLQEKEPHKACQPREMGMVLANRSASLDTDRKHQQLIDTLGDAEASPAVFVYTLPNVVMGELCIRYKIQGENTFFITQNQEEGLIRQYAEMAMKRQNLKACLVGWCELSGDHYEARFEWIERINE